MRWPKNADWFIMLHQVHCLQNVSNSRSFFFRNSGKFPVKYAVLAGMHTLDRHTDSKVITGTPTVLPKTKWPPLTRFITAGQQRNVPFIHSPLTRFSLTPPRDLGAPDGRKREAHFLWHSSPISATMVSVYYKVKYKNLRQKHIQKLVTNWSPGSKRRDARVQSMHLRLRWRKILFCRKCTVRF